MSQYGAYQEGYYQQTQEAPGHTGSPVQQQATHHSKRRHYPTPQYDFSNSTPTPPNYYPGAPGYGLQQSNSTPGQEVFTPAAGYNASPSGSTSYIQPQADSLSSNFGAMNLGYGQQSQSMAPRLNQLYNIDLLAAIPPPISDLDLPPPPIILPPTATDSRNLEANASSEFVRSTLNVVPTTSSLLKKSKLPFSLVFRPYTSLKNDDAPIPVTQDTLVCRCDRCRAYINPFVKFSHQGDEWFCNICDKSNKVPPNFNMDFSNRMQPEFYSRTEVKYGVCEFIAPPEYLVRPPQAPTYVFLIEVSAQAVESGLVATAAKAIQESLDQIPNKNDLTKVAFIGVDSSLHYFHLPSTPDGEPSIAVVADLEDPFLPLPHGILVKLSECRASIDLFLSRLGEMFANNTNTNNALGSALRSAHKLISNIGGKVICLSSNLPNVGHAKLSVRESKKFLGTSKESSLFQPASSFYKSFAIDCNQNQVTIDMFLFGNGYQDVVSLSSLPHFTAGQTYFYPGWNGKNSEDVIKFTNEFKKHLSMEISMEAVLKVRASSGIQIKGYHGNFFSRTEELCSFPTLPRDQGYSVDLTLSDTIKKPWVSVQICILLTTCDEERRLRVITLSIPTSSNLTDIYASADQLAITAQLTHAAVEKAVSSGLDSAREYLQGRLMEILHTYKKELLATNTGTMSSLHFSANLRMLPLLVNALLKNLGFKKNFQIPFDLRAATLALLSTMPLKYLIKFIYPDLFSLYDMPEEAGLPKDGSDEIVLPPKLNLISERIVPHGLYLINDGQKMFIWVGRDVVPQLCLDAFGVDSIKDVPEGKVDFPESDSELNKKIRNIIASIRNTTDSITYPSLFIVKDSGDPSMRFWALSNLIEDRNDDNLSYYQFLTSIRDKLNT